MAIPTQKQAYAPSSGTAKIPSFRFSDTDPPLTSNEIFDLYQGWVNTSTKAIWYLEGSLYTNGSYQLLWRSVAPNILQTVNPSSSDYQYPVGQPWINTSNQTYWALVSVSGTTATWIELSAGGSSGILTVTGNSGGAISGDGARNLNLVGGTGVNIIGNSGTNTLTVTLTGGGVAVDSIGVDAGASPVEPTSAGLVTMTGGQVAAGTTSNVIRTNSDTANTLSIDVQRSSAIGSSTVGLNGVSHYNSADFVVDSNGFVSALGSGFARLVEVDTSSGSGTDPVVPTNTGVITVTGGQVAAATTANAIRTISTAANSYTIQAQRTSTSASPNVDLNGICHFNSTHFTVDSDGFVSSTGGGGGGGFTVVNVQTITATGTYTPTSGTQYALVQVVGGGAGGGGASIDGGDTAPAGSGGGGGLYAYGLFDATAIGASQAVTIGAGGTGGVAQADGVDGGTTSFGTLIVASGGVKGLYMRASGPVQEGGDGGQAVSGTTEYSSFGGGGGYAISVSGAVVSGAGGASLLSTGGKARAVVSNGMSAGGYGGGGSGAVAGTSSPGNGGAGSSGVVIVTEFIS